MNQTRSIPSLFGLALSTLAAAAAAQDAPPTGEPATAPTEPVVAATLVTEAVATVDAPELDAAATLRATIALPVAADEAYAAGEDEGEVADVVRELRQRHVRPDHAASLLHVSADAAGQHGRIDHFGAFVQARLAEGLRGRSLSEAIRAEHVARGRGPSRAAQETRRPDGVGGGRPEGAASPGEHANQAADHAAPASAGHPADDRRPEGAGRPGETPPRAGLDRAPDDRPAR